MSAQKGDEQDVYAVLLIFRRKSKSRIKTTVGFDRETYMKLKLLSIVLKKDMQDIIAEALKEYFERNDVKAVLSTIFKTNFKSTNQER